MITADATILVTGGGGMVGGQMVRTLRAAGFTDVRAPRRAELDLLDEAAVNAWMADAKPDAVIHCAGLVGGIVANQGAMAAFFEQNLRLGMHVVGAAHRAGVPRLVNLGSTCIYPRDCPQPIREDYLLTGPLEPSNEGYALAKIAVLKYVEYLRQSTGRAYMSLMPTNVYGDGDNYHPEHSHAFPALLRKVVTAAQRGERQIPVWGSGRPVREFVHSQDVAGAALHLLRTYDGSQGIVNIGTGVGVTIRELVETILEVVGHEAEPVFDASRPDGTPVKISDVSRLQGLGYTAKIDLRTGIGMVCETLAADGWRWHERRH